MAQASGDTPPRDAPGGIALIAAFLALMSGCVCVMGMIMLLGAYGFRVSGSMSGFDAELLAEHGLILIVIGIFGVTLSEFFGIAI